MTSTIVTGATEEKREAYILAWCGREKIAPVDQRILELEASEEKVTKQSIGIDVIKQMQKQLYLTPVQSKQKAIIILQADTLTTEAQNALLKVLEEPPMHTVFFLSANSAESFLSTIRSRCAIVKLDQEVKELSGSERTSHVHVLQAMLEQSIEHPLELAESYGKTKDMAKSSLETLLVVLHDEIQSGKFADPQILRSILQTYHAISSTNANHRLLLESLFLTYTPIAS